MKPIMKRMLALLLALLVAFPTFALAEEQEFTSEVVDQVVGTMEVDFDGADDMNGLIAGDAETVDDIILSTDTDLSSEDAEVPAEDAEVPAEDAEVPAEDAELPAEDAELPAEDAELPAEDAELPAEDAELPAEDAEFPAEDAEAPVEDAETPAEDVEAPAEDAEAPAEDVEAPAEDAEAPAEDVEAPAEDAEAPAEDAEAEKKPEYVFKGDTGVALTEILEAVGLSGEAEAVEVSNPELILASDETGEWIITALAAFTTEEWMKVTIDDTPFEIVLKYAAEAEEAEQPEVGEEAGQPEAGAEAEQPEAGEEAAIVAEIAAVTELSSDEMVNNGPNLLISSSCLDFIDVTIAIGGAVQESSSGLFSVATGTEVVVTATPKAGSGVQPEDINFNCNQFGMEQINTVSENGSRVLTFTKAESSDNAGVVVEITPPEGCALVSINPNQISNGTVTSNVAYARAGDQIIITATPDEGYEMSYVNLSCANPERDEWNGNVVKVYFTAPDPLPASPITVYAYFGTPSIYLNKWFDENYCDLAVTINGKAAAGTNGGYQYNASIGDEITVTATPKNNGTIRSEYTYLEIKEEHIPFVLQSDGSYVASFTRQGGIREVYVNIYIEPPTTAVKVYNTMPECTVSIAVDGEVKETTTMQNNSILAFANKGAVVTITATPGENYCLLSGAFRFNGKYYDGEPVGESGARTYTFTKEEHPDTVEVVFATANTDATITIAGNGEEETFNRTDNGDRFEVKEGKLWFIFPETTKGYPSVSAGKKLAYRRDYGAFIDTYMTYYAGNTVEVYGPAKYAVEEQATVPVVCQAENGTLTCSVDSVAANERFTVTATANQGFQVGGVTATYAGNSINVNYSEGNPYEMTYSFTAPATLNAESADPVTVTATFNPEPQPAAPTNLSIGEFDKEYCDLTVTINGEPATSLYGNSYYAKDGDTVVMTATPKKGATLNPNGFCIYQNGKNINAVEKDGSYVLTFTKSGENYQYVTLNVIPPADVVTINHRMGVGAVTIAVNGQVLGTAVRGNNGQSEPIASASVKEGDTVVITATPGDGWCLMEESFGKQEIGSDGNRRNMEYADGTPKGNDGVREYSFVKGSGAVEVDVWFETSQCTVTMTGNGVTKEYSKKNNPDLFKGRQGTQCFICPEFNPFGSTQAGQKVVYTRGGSGETYSAGSWIQLWGAQNITLTAELRGTVPVEISQVEHGTVTCNVTSAAAGEEIIITATPDQDYYFDESAMRVECGGTPLNRKYTDYDGNTAELHYSMPAELPTSPVTVAATFRYNGGSGNTSIYVSNSDYGEITGITVDGVAQPVPQGSSFMFETKTGSTVVITAKPKKGGSLNPNEMSATDMKDDPIATAVSKLDGSCELTFTRTNNDYIGVYVSFAPPETAVIASINGNTMGGTVSIAINGVTEATTTDDKWSISAEANVGDKITVTATPNAGYCLLPGAFCWEGVYSDGEAVGNGGARAYTLTKNEWSTYVEVRFVSSDVPSITLNGGGQSRTYTRQANPAQFVARKGIWNFTIPTDFNPLGNAPSGKKLVFTDVSGESQDGARVYSPGSAYELSRFYFSDEIDLYALFRDYCTVTVPNTDHGTLTASITNPAAGEMVTITTKAEDGYWLDSETITLDYDGGIIKCNWSEGSQQEGVEHHFWIPNPLPAKALTVNAEFIKEQGGNEDGYKIKHVIDGNGQIIGPDQWTAGEYVGLSPVPDAGYALTNVKVVGNNSGNALDAELEFGLYVFKMTNEDVTFTATFTKVSDVADGVVINTANFADDALRGHIAKVFGRKEGDTLSAFECKQLNTLELFKTDEYGQYLEDADGECITLGVSNLKGIEHFPNLRVLNCSETKNLKSIDLSGNPGLRELYCDENDLSTLDLSHTPDLENLWCCGNENLKRLDLWHCPNLVKLVTADNRNANANPGLAQYGAYKNEEGGTEWRLCFDEDIELNLTPLYGLTLGVQGDGDVELSVKRKGQDAFKALGDTPEAAEGDTVKVTVTPAQNCEIESVTAAWGENATPITLTDEGNGVYTFTMVKGKATVSVSIKNSLGITWPTGAEGLVYTGEAQALVSGGATLTGTMKYSEDKTTWTDAVPAKTDAGSYTVYCRAEGVTGYGDVDMDAPIEVAIGKKTVTVTIGAQNKLYGQADPDINGIMTVDGLIVGDALTGEPTRKAGSDVGEYAYQKGSLSAGDNDKNYEIKVEGALTIKPCPVTVTITGRTNAEEIIYDGQEHSIESYSTEFIANEASPEAVLDKEKDIELAEGVRAEAKRTRAGTAYMGLTAESFVNKNGNFEVTFAVSDGALTIKPLIAELKWSNTPLTYSGFEQTPVCEVTNLVKGDMCKVVVTGAGVEVGEYTATAASLSNADYKLPENCTTAFAIGKATLDQLPESSKPETETKPVAVSFGGVTDATLDLSKYLENATNWSVKPDSFEGILTDAKKDAGNVLIYTTREVDEEITTGSVVLVVENAHYENYDLTVKFVANSRFTLSFNSDGGSQAASRKLEKGEKYGELPQVEKYGYTHNGWYTDAGRTTRATENDTMDDADVTLYAGWSVNEYRITLDLNNEEATIPEGYDQTVANGVISFNVENKETFELPVLKDTNSRTFAGWQLTEDEPAQRTVSIDPATFEETAVGQADGEGPMVFGATYTAQWAEAITVGTVKFDAPVDANSGIMGLAGMEGNVSTENDQVESKGTLAETMKEIACEKSEDVGKDIAPEEIVSKTVNVDMTVSASRIDKEKENGILEIVSRNQADETPMTEFLEIDITQTTTIEKKAPTEAEPDKTETKTSDPEPLTELTRILEIPIKYDMTGRYNPQLYRTHNGETSPMTRLTSRPKNYQDKEKYEGTFYVSGVGQNAIIYVYSSLFSTFTVATNETETYCVMFESDGRKVSDKTANAGNEYRIGKPEDPTKPAVGAIAYRFVAWFTDKACTTRYNFDAQVDRDMTLYAGFAEMQNVEVTVTGYTGDYDGKPHQVSAAVPANTDISVYYSVGEPLTANDFKDELKQAPSATEPGTTKVYWYAVSENDTCIPNPASGTVEIKINTLTPEIVTEPKARTLTSNGESQALIEAGEAKGGTMLYKLANGEYSKEIPTAKEAGTYTVYYMVKGDKHYHDLVDENKYVVNATIAAAEQPATAAPATTAPAPEPTPVIPVLKKNVKKTVSAAPGAIYQIDAGGKTGKSFKSSKKKVAVVDQTGLITIKAKGKTKITFKVGKKRRTLTLTVKDPTIPTSVSFAPVASKDVKKGDTVTLVPVIPDGTNSTFKWKSSNKKVASVNSDGTVTFKKKGKVTITATAKRGGKKAKIKFTVSNQ